MTVAGDVAFRELSLAASQDPALHLALSRMPLRALWTVLGDELRLAGTGGSWTLIPGSATNLAGAAPDPTPALAASDGSGQVAGLLAVVAGEDSSGSVTATLADPAAWRFTPLTGAHEAPQTAMPTPPAAAPAPPPPADAAGDVATQDDQDDVVNFCPECGTAARGARRFCGGCGASLTGGERHPAAVAAAAASGAAYGAGTSPATLANPVTIQGRTAPLDVWLLVGSAWFGAALFALLSLLVVRVSLDYLGSFSVWSLFSGLTIALIGAIALAFGALLAWLGLGVLNRDATAPWLGAAAGGVLLVGTLIHAVTTRSLGAYPLLTLCLILVSLALVGFGAFSPGIRAHSEPPATDGPPLTMVVATGLSRWIMFLFAINGLVSLAYLIAALGSGYAEFKLLPLGIILLAGSGAVFWASRTVLAGDPTARLLLTCAAGFAALSYVLLNDSYGNGAWFGWVQVCISVTVIVLLWLPTSSSFFRDQSGASR